MTSPASRKKSKVQIAFRQKYVIFLIRPCHCVAQLEAFLGRICNVQSVLVDLRENGTESHTDPGRSRDRVLHEILA